MKNAIFLSWSSIVSKPLSATLSLLSVAFAIALLCALSLLVTGIENGFIKNSKNIDVVVGAKGSPLQLVLSSVYHIDIPNGNIDKDDAIKISKNPNVKKAVSIAVGDNYKGFRVVGTTTDFFDLYDLKLSSGVVFQKPFEVLAGSATNLRIGQTFAASHGFSTDSHDVHDDNLYKVVGVLERSGTVADKLLLTPYQSVQKAHAHHDHGDEHTKHDHHDEHSHESETLGQEITSLLIEVKTPLSAMTLPREINKDENLLAASPSYEMAKLSKSFGVGERFVFAVSMALMGVAMVMIFSNLTSNLIARQYDLAVIRVLGASPQTIFLTVLFEGALIGFVGAVLGVLLGHVATYAAVATIPSLQTMMVPTDMLKFQIQDLYFIGLGLLSGCLAAVLPARKSLKIDISALLAKGHS